MPRPLLLLTMTLLLLPVRTASPVGAQSLDEGFAVVGANDLNARGMNAGLAMAGTCVYVGSRGGNQGSLILDVADPTSPRIAGQIPASPGSTPRELRADDRLNLLVILNYRLDPGVGSPNSLDLYDIADCQRPAIVGRFDFGDALPHEFFLWKGEGRVLAYVTMWGYVPNLRVIDLTDPADPTLVATWDSSAVGISSRLHSVSVTPDGTRAYLADWDAGLMILDTSALANGRSDPTPRLLTGPNGLLLLAWGNLHSAVPIPDSEYVVTTQEIYGPGTCPYGRLQVVDVGDPATPAVVGSFGIPENDPANCGTTVARDGAFTTHNPLVVGRLAFVSWYAGGLRAVDLRRPASPREVGSFVPDPLPSVSADDFTLGSYPIRVWSYPIVKDGLLYVVDIRNGLYVLRYTGPGAAAIAAVAFTEGNATP